MRKDDRGQGEGEEVRVDEARIKDRWGSGLRPEVEGGRAEDGGRSEAQKGVDSSGGGVGGGGRGEIRN